MLVVIFKLYWYCFGLGFGNIFDLVIDFFVEGLVFNLVVYDIFSCLGYFVFGCLVDCEVVKYIGQDFFLFLVEDFVVFLDRFSNVFFFQDQVVGGDLYRCLFFVLGL